jgi:hypothetical protein
MDHLRSFARPAFDQRSRYPARAAAAASLSIVALQFVIKVNNAMSAHCGRVRDPVST